MGGLFGVAAYYINLGLSMLLPGKLDTVSATIVIIGIICKALWGNEGIFGKVPEGDKRFGVYSKNNWMPHMPYGEGVMYWLFAGGVGLLSAWIYWEISEYAKAVNSELIASVAIFPAFALAVISLTLLCTGLPCPVFHHIGLVASYGAMTAYAVGADQLTVLLWGMSCGIISHFAADILADVFLVYGDGYVDPPSLSMAVCSLFTWIVFPALGLYNGVMVTVTPVVLLTASGIFAVVVQMKRNTAKKTEAEAAV